MVAKIETFLSTTFIFVNLEVELVKNNDNPTISTGTWTQLLNSILLCHLAWKAFFSQIWSSVFVLLMNTLKIIARAGALSIGLKTCRTVGQNPDKQILQRSRKVFDLSSENIYKDNIETCENIPKYINEFEEWMNNYVYFSR